MVSRFLDLLGGQLGQLAPLALPHEFQVPPVGVDVYGPALELVGQETVGPTGGRDHGDPFVPGVQEPTDALSQLVAPLGGGPRRVVGPGFFPVAVDEQGEQREFALRVQEHQRVDDGVGQAPVPALESAGGGHVEPVPDQVVAQVPGELPGAMERELRLRVGVPQVGAGRGALEGIAVHFSAGVQAEGRKVVLQEVLRLVVADDQQDVRFPLVEAVAHGLERLHDFFLVADVLAQSVVLPQFLQQLGGRLVARHPGKQPLSALGPHFGRSQNDRAVGTSYA